MNFLPSKKPPASAITALIFPVIITILFLIMNLNLYRRPVGSGSTTVDKRILNQLNFLDCSVAHSGPARMQRLFPEGAFFLHSLHTLSWIEVARRSPVTTMLFRASLEKSFAGLKVMEDDLQTFLGLQALSPPYGVFFTGWLNWTRGALLSLGVRDSQTDMIEVEFKKSCEQIAKAYENCATPYLESYPEMTWPSDNVVCIASLRMHDRLFGNKYAPVINRWLEMVKTRLDPETGMIPYQTRARSGSCLAGSQGNSQAVIIRFLAELDPALAAEQYRLYCAGFPAKRLGLCLVKAYPGRKRGMGNIDSGPVIWGIGSAATMVAPCAMRLFGDSLNYFRIEQSIDALGFPLTFSGKTRYAFGLMPIADAFLVWSRLARPYTQTVPVISQAAADPFWRIPFHLFSIVLVVLSFLPAAVVWIKKNRTVS